MAMVKPYIWKIVQEAAAAPDLNSKVMVLRKHDHPALRTYLTMAIDNNLRWALPPGAPPYDAIEEDKALDLEHVMYNELRRVYIFIEGGNPNLSSRRREELFRFFLESVHPRDAEFFINVVKDRHLPDGISAEVIKIAFGIR